MKSQCFVNFFLMSRTIEDKVPTKSVRSVDIEIPTSSYDARVTERVIRLG